MKKYCWNFVSSILTLSILSVANNSFALPVRLNTSNAYFYQRPDVTSNSANRINQRDSKLELDYCRQDDSYDNDGNPDAWCKITNFYILHSPNPNQPYSIDPWNWVRKRHLCDDPTTDFYELLPCFYGARNVSNDSIPLPRRMSNQPTTTDCMKLSNYLESQLLNNISNISEIENVVFSRPSNQQISIAREQNYGFVPILYPQCQPQNSL